MAVMNWMRRTSKYFLVAVVLTFVASLAYFGATQNGGGGGEWAVTVNGHQISAVAYLRAYRSAEEQYRQVFRDRFTAELARSLKLQEQVIEGLVTERLIQQQAAKEGIVVTDQELAEQIQRIPAFQEAGRFSRDRYIRVLARANPPMTPSAFEEDFRLELTRQKVQGLITDGVKVTEAEVRQRWAVEHARVRTAYLLVPPAPPESVAVTDAELESHRAANAAQFARPERRRALVALLPNASVPAPTVTDADVEAAYKARQAQFAQPARVRAAHILVRVPSVGGSAAEDQARAKAQAALERVRGGTPFAQVARETSEDTGTAARGGDLGLVAQGELAAEVDRALFALKKGELGGPVRSPFGYHVLTVTEQVPASKKDLKEVAPTLRATLVAEGMLKALRDKAQEVRGALVVAADFAVEARKRGLTVREVGPLAKADPIEGIGRIQEAGDALFALPPNGVSEPIKVADGYAIFRLVDTQPAQAPQDVKLAEVREAVLRAVQRQKAQEAAQAKAGLLAEAWRKGEDPRALAKREGATFAEVGPFSRAEPLADRALGQAIGPVALALPEGAIGEPVSGPGGVYVVKTTSRDEPDAAAFVTARAALEARLLQEKRTQIFQGWVAGLRGPAKVEINRRILPQT
jgi:peptidyl-prolyl cis-trans isomerase D